MKKTRLVCLLFALSLIYIVTTSSELGRAEDDMVGNTGAPQENQLCSNCHNNGNGFGVVSLSIEVFQLGTTTPVTTYFAGTAYDMRVTVTNSSGSPAGYGFQMTALTTPGNVPIAGYSNLGSNVQQVLLTNGVYNGRTYLEQPTMSVSNQFNFRWTAPAAGMGNVRFYTAGNAVNGNNSSSGDKSGNTNLTLSEMFPLVQTNSFASPTCFGLNNGFINFTVTGGVQPYSFLWSDGDTSEDRSNLIGGNYSVAITDGAGNLIQQSFDLLTPTELAVAIAIDNPLFPGENGIVDFAVSGGAGPYTISITGVGEVGSTLNLQDGVYAWCVLDDNGCSSCGEFEVVVPDDIEFSVDVISVSCFGENDGSASIAVSGATPPYNIEWSNGDTGLFADNLGPAIYDVFLTDAVGYTVLYFVAVDEPAEFTAQSSLEGIACFGETATVAVEGIGGTWPYVGTGIFQLLAGEYSYIVMDANECIAELNFELNEPDDLQVVYTSESIPCAGGISEVVITAQGGTEPYTGAGIQEVNFPGTYLYSISDANGCEYNISVLVSPLDGPNVISATTDVTCYDSCEGSIIVSLENEIEPYTAMWSDGSEGLVREDLCIGEYSLVYIDGGGCIIVGSYLVEGPEPIEVEFLGTEIDCFGSTTTVTALTLGGSGPYTFLWSNGEETPGIISFSGTVEVQVTDNNLCMYSESIQITELSPLTISETSNSALCFGDMNGSASLNVSGGTEPYDVLWTNGSILSELQGLGSGNYGFSIQDSNGCIESGEVFVDQPAPLVITIVNVNGETDTELGSIEIGIEGGSGNYTYEWSNGQISEDLFDLVAGLYTITVTDENGCQDILENIEVELFIGLSEWSSASAIGMFPNPSTEWVSISSRESITHLIVTNEMGRVICELFDPGTSFTFECKEWSAGIYFARMRSENSLTVQKLLKE